MQQLSSVQSNNKSNFIIHEMHDFVNPFHKKIVYNIKYRTNNIFVGFRLPKIRGWDDKTSTSFADSQARKRLKCEDAVPCGDSLNRNF